MSHPHQIVDPTDAKRFVLGNNARITLVSKATGTRFSYRIRGKSNDGDGNDAHGIALPGRADIYFVSVLTGPDNEADYQYLGIIDAMSIAFRRTAKSRIGIDAPSCKAFTFFWGWLADHGRLHEGIELWHEGACGVCNRPLTVPASIERGIGPDCAARLGII